MTYVIHKKIGVYFKGILDCYLLIKDESTTLSKTVKHLVDLQTGT